MRHRQQARELSDGHAFLQGKEGCARREREESGVISKAGIESRIQSPGQRVQAAGSPGADVVTGRPAGSGRGARLPAGPREVGPGA